MLQGHLKWAVMFVTAAVVNAVPGHGQTKWSVNVHAGLAITRVWAGSNTTKDGWFFQPAPVAGITVGRAVSSFFSLQGQLNYDEIKSKKEGLLLLDPGSVTFLPAANKYYAYVNNRMVLNYISAGALARFYFGNELTMYVEAGPFIAWLFHSRFITKGRSLIYYNSSAKDVVMLDGTHTLPVQTIDNARSMHNDILPLNVGASTGIGIQLPFGNKRFGIAALYTFGVTNIRRKPLRGEIYKTDQLSIRLSYTF